MNENTKIEWTDKTWNPVSGCTKVSPGCAHCYAERITERFHGPGSFEKIVLHPERLEQPLHIRKPSRIFVNSMSDLFHEKMPDEFIDRVFSIMAVVPRHIFQILTKRPKRMRAYCANNETKKRLISEIVRLTEGLPGCSLTIPGDNGDGLEGMSFPNVWLGVSVENQHFADERIPLLLETPAAVRFISAEPLLGPIDLGNGVNPGPACDLSRPWEPPTYRLPQINWVIVGGESGPEARPMNPDWARSLRDQCKDAGVAFFMKQMGGVSDKGGSLDMIPEDLRIREFPA